MKIWTRAQVKAFLEATESDPLFALWRLAATTGMRRGELLGLRWKDLDLKRGRVAIRQAVTRSEQGPWTFGPTKTKAGRRSIAIDSKTVAALQEHRQRQAEIQREMGPAFKDQDLVFGHPDGSRLDPDVVSRDRFGEAVDKAELPRIRFHDYADLLVMPTSGLKAA